MALPGTWLKGTYTGTDRQAGRQAGRQTHSHTDTHTLDKNGSLYDPSGTESCDMQIRLVSYLDKDENI